MGKGKSIRRARIAAISGVLIIPLLIVSASVMFMTGADNAALSIAARCLKEIDPAPYLHAPLSPVMVDRNGATLYAFLADDEQWRFPVALERITPLLTQATLAAEDKRFYHHPGMDMRAALRALWLNMRARRYVSGASTLTMQLVKRHASTPRTLYGKARQALLALRLDHAVDKDTLLEAYLNTAPYGGNLVGAEAAARRYFGKSCMELTLSEAALLAGLPKSPVMLDPLRHPGAARQRRNHVLRRMLQDGMIRADAYQDAIAHPLGAAWHDYPMRAPHLAMTHREEIRRLGVMGLTLDGALQARLETLLPRYLKQYDNQITNAAVIVVDTQRGEVLARVASADFTNAHIAGQVDMCRAPRAPGSTLKPFVYALAMERQRLYPTEALLDNTLDYGIYNPGNFDGAFNGMVSAGEALRWSLNIPAVQAQRRAGVAETIAFLRTLGIETLHRSAEHYGLGLVLGNCELRLESLVEAYLALARLGAHAPLRLRADQTNPPPGQVISEGVALAVWRMLEQPFPDEPWTNLVRIGDRTTRLCWKTGTSTGYHDAWAVAFNRHYVVGAWLGNHDGRPAERLVGARAALPLVARVFRSLPVPLEPDWPTRENRLIKTDLCAVTGMPKGPWCPTIVEEWLPREQYLHRRCDVHRPGPDGNLIAHWPTSPHNWDLAAVPAMTAPQATMARHTGPTDAGQAQESPATRRQALAIIAPANNATYMLTGDIAGDRIRLNAGSNSATLHWYHNDRYLGRSKQITPLYLQLTPGEHQVACMDDSGQTDTVTFTVLAG